MRIPSSVSKILGGKPMKEDFTEREEINGWTIYFHRSNKWVAVRNGIVQATNRDRDKVVAFAKNN